MELAGTGGDEGDEGGLDFGSVALPGPNRETVALPGLNSGTGAPTPLLWHSPRAILGSPSAMV